MPIDVEGYLREKGIPYLVRPHSKGVYTVEEAAKERNIRPEQIVKTLIITHSGQQFFAVLLTGDKQLSWKKIKTAVGKGVRMASPEEIKDQTGYIVGAIAPVGLRELGFDILVDQSVLKQTYIDISSGRPEAGIEVRCEDLLSLIDGKVVDCSK